MKGAIQPEELPMLSGPLLVVLHFQIPATLGMSEYKRKEFEGKNHLKRADGDNLEKFVNDSLSGVIWKDDAQIAWCLRSKTYTADKIGSITIFARELTDFANYKEILRDIKDNLEIR